MKTTLKTNSTSISFNVIAAGNDSAIIYNEILGLCRKHKAQDAIFENSSPWVFDKSGEIIGSKLGNFGGTITFHSSLCDKDEASKEMIGYFEDMGYKNKFFKEVIKTHRTEATFHHEAGSAYKVPQTFIEEIK